jgi:hypothetical protein
MTGRPHAELDALAHRCGASPRNSKRPDATEHLIPGRQGVAVIESQQPEKLPQRSHFGIDGTWCSAAAGNLS